MSIIVETHASVFRPGTLDTLVTRFAPTHEIRRVDQALEGYEAPWWVKEMCARPAAHRLGIGACARPPWLVMRPKAPPSGFDTGQARRTRLSYAASINRPLLPD